MAGENLEGTGLLRNVIATLKNLKYPIKGYVPTASLHVDHEGKLYDTMPPGVPRGGYFR